MNYLTPRPNVRRWGFLLFLVCALLALALPAAAQSYHITRFDDVITVHDDGSLVVEESLRFAFEGSFHGIHRRIPVEYPGPTGTNYTLFLSVQSVTDESGSPLKFESKLKGKFRELTIYIPGAEDTEKTVKITYAVKNGVRFLKREGAGHAELYWNVTGNDWTVPIDEASAFVVLPPATAGQLKAEAYTGEYGSTGRDATSHIEGSSVRFETTRGLQEREGLTIDIYIPDGILHQPGAFTRAMWFIASNPISLLPFWSLVVMFGMWWLIGREPDPGISVAPMYQPPAEMSPGETGALLDNGVAPRDITCTIIDLAVRGYLKIEETDQKLLIFHHKDYIFHLLKARESWGQDLAAHEREMLENMFNVGDNVVALSDLKNRFYVALPAVKEEIMQRLKGKQVYRVDPNSAKGYAFLGAIIVALPFVLLKMAGILQTYSVLVTVFAIVISVVIFLLFARRLSSMSLRGARMKVEILGFKEFMTRVDEDRIRHMPPDTFEKFLPFAMALGVEQHWAHAFQGIIKDPPSWYVGPTPMGMWSPVMFASSMGGLSDSAYSAFSSAPQSSSSGGGFGDSGGGGGGFSGGGFGGGGGDAF